MSRGGSVLFIVYTALQHIGLFIAHHLFASLSKHFYIDTEKFILFALTITILWISFHKTLTALTISCAEDMFLLDYDLDGLPKFILGKCPPQGSSTI